MSKPTGTKNASAEEKAGMVAAYQSGLTAKQAAAQFGFKPGACLKAMQDLGVASRRYRATPEQQKRAAELYEQGMSLSEAGAAVGFSSSACYSALRIHGVESRAFTTRQYAYNDRYFETIDTEEKAYWLGFIAADGCIVKEGLHIGLQRRDRGHLVKFLQALGASCEIRDVDRGLSPSSKMSIWCKAMTEDLARLGITERKSLIVPPWKGDSELIRHYWRGVMDGDGCISFSKATGRWTAGVCGSKAMTEAFAAFAKDVTGGSVRAHARGAIWTATVGGKYQPQQLARVLYEGSSVYLDRKYARACELMNQHFTQRFSPEIDSAELRREYEGGLSTGQLAVKYGMSNVAIRLRIRKAGGELRSWRDAQKLNVAGQTRGGNGRFTGRTT